MKMRADTTLLGARAESGADSNRQDAPDSASFAAHSVGYY